MELFTDWILLALGLWLLKDPGTSDKSHQKVRILTHIGIPDLCLWSLEEEKVVGVLFFSKFKLIRQNICVN